MDDQPWLNRVRQRLDQQALPASYVQRLVEELRDHLEDLKEENMEADPSTRIGEPEEVAEAAVVAYRQRSFLARHPTAAFLVFAISPYLPQCALATVLLNVLGIFTGSYTYGEHVLGDSLIIMICSAFVAIMYGELAVWLGIGKKWLFTSCSVLGVIAMQWGSVPNDWTYWHAVRLFLQFAAPLAVGWWFSERKYHRSRPATVFFVFAISPVVSLLVLWCIALLATVAISSFNTATPGGEHLGFAALYTTLTLFQIVIPSFVAPLVYCKLGGWCRIGRKWMLVSCAVLTTFAPLGSYPTVSSFGTLNGWPVGLTICVILAQFLLPLAIAWWFMRRYRDQTQPRLAS